MNQKGIEQFLSTVSVGDEISLSTREFSYEGKVVSLHDSYLVIEEYEMAIKNTLNHSVDYKDIYWHSAESQIV